MFASEIINFLREKNVKLVLVTKNRSIEEIKSVLRYGITDIGENRIDSFKRISRYLPDNINKHFIGRIQSNKIRYMVENFHFIQSVYKVDHLLKIDEIATKLKKNIEVFIQVNISGEIQKGGIPGSDLYKFLGIDLKNTFISGIMGIATNTSDINKIRDEFKLLKDLSIKYNVKYVSMGMSNDFMVAVEEGSNMVRIGTKMFS